MKQQVIIVNGRGGVGKDTICDLAAQFYRTRKVSSITPIQEIARHGGWNGEKTPASRRLLSQLKAAFTEFNDLPLTYCLEQYEAFRASDAQFLFVHIREPVEIERFRVAVVGNCRALLVHRDEIEQKGSIGNCSDDGVNAYEYDDYFNNSSSLATLADNVHQYLKQVLDGADSIRLSCD